MIVIKVEFLNLKKEVTISNKELIKGIKSQFETNDTLELIAGLLNGMDVSKLNPGQLNALKVNLNNFLNQLK